MLYAVIAVHTGLCIDRQLPVLVGSLRITCCRPVIKFIHKTDINPGRAGLTAVAVNTRTEIRLGYTFLHLKHLCRYYNRKLRIFKWNLMCYTTLEGGDGVIPKQDNYAIQASQAKARFLTYDQQELIRRCSLEYDENYFYIRLLSEPFRICRRTGNMERKRDNTWTDANSFGEVMTVLDWLCDSRPDRSVSGNWVNVITAGPGFHRGFQEDADDPNAQHVAANPEAFRKACESLGGVKIPGADIGYQIEFVDRLPVLVQFWYGDEEFAPRLRCLWDQNVLQYLRYETTFYAVGLLMKRIRENM